MVATGAVWYQIVEKRLIGVNLIVFSLVSDIKFW